MSANNLAYHVEEYLEPEAFWRAWAARYPGREPLVTAWVNLWPTLVQEWENQYGDLEGASPWSLQGEWVDFDWEEHAPTFDPYDEAVEDLDWHLTNLVEAIAEHVKALSLPTLETITRTDLPHRFDPDRSATTWQDVTTQIQNRTELRVPLYLLSSAHQEDLWTSVINAWDMGDDNPYSSRFEEHLPAWMVTWLKDHPNHFLHDHYDTATRQPKDAGWRAQFHNHKLWATAAI